MDSDRERAAKLRGQAALLLYEAAQLEAFSPESPDAPMCKKCAMYYQRRSSFGESYWMHPEPVCEWNTPRIIDIR